MINHISKDVNLFNAFHQAETNQVLKMAQLLWFKTEEYGNTVDKRKRRGSYYKADYWHKLIKNGCQYTMSTFRSRWLTMKHWPELLKCQTLPVAFSIYRDIANSSRKLGKVNCHILKFKAEKNIWSYDDFLREFRLLLNKKPDRHLCECPVCHTKHRPIYKQKIKEPLATRGIIIHSEEQDEYRSDMSRDGILTNIEA